MKNPFLDFKQQISIILKPIPQYHTLLKCHCKETQLDYFSHKIFLHVQYCFCRNHSLASIDLNELFLAHCKSSPSLNEDCYQCLFPMIIKFNYLDF